MERIRFAVYSNIHVYEMAVRNTPLMIRKGDGFVNATQILRAAGLPKPARTKVLEREVTRGIHEKVQGGYAGSQGTWIPLDSAILLARQYEIYDDCLPLFSYDMTSGNAELTSPPVKHKRNPLPKQFSDESEDDKSERKRTSSNNPSIPARQARARVRKSFADDENDDSDSSPVAEKYQKTDLASTLNSDQSYISHNAGKRCEVCKVYDTPQWRRGPNGKRTLCNSCGVKYSTGKLPLQSSPGGSSSFPFSLSESETMTASEQILEEVEVGSEAWKLQLELSRLKSKLRESELTKKKLSKLLGEGQSTDRDVDRLYRKIISGAKKSLASIFQPKHASILNNLFLQYQDELDSDLEEDDEASIRYGDASARDVLLEQKTVLKFVNKIKR